MCQIRPIDERQTADLRKKQQQKKQRSRLCNRVRSKIEKRKQSLYIYVIIIVFSYLGVDVQGR